VGGGKVLKRAVGMARFNMQLQLWPKMKRVDFPMTQKPLPHDPVQYDHLAAFGSIIHSFAEIEWLMQISISALSQIDDWKIIALTKELSYKQKRDTLYSYMMHDKSKEAHFANLKILFDEVETHNKLRNNIAHAIWRNGKRAGSIKPMNFIVRGGRGKIVGQSDDEKDYTFEDLGRVADRLRHIHSSIFSYIKQSGLIPNMDTALPE
jgi:hypothetical protein